MLFKRLARALRVVFLFALGDMVQCVVGFVVDERLLLFVLDAVGCEFMDVVATCLLYTSPSPRDS